MNSDGTVIAISQPESDYETTNTGNVTVYECVKGLWKPIGGNLYGSASQDKFGHHISLNGTGDIIAISSGKSTYGLIRVFQYRKLTQQEWDSGNKTSNTGAPGVPIIATAVNYNLKFPTASAVSMLYSGQSHTYFIHRPYSLMTKVPDHKFWIQLGDDIVGGTSVGPQNAGLSMDLSKDGFTLASGQPLGDIDHIVNGSMHHSRRGQNGKVFIYKYTTPGSTGGTWKEVNATSEITYIGNNRAANGAGEAPSAAGTITGDWYDQLGSSVSMSDDASIIAVTSSHFDPFADGNSTRRNSQTNFGKFLYTNICHLLIVM